MSNPTTLSIESTTIIRLKILKKYRLKIVFTEFYRIDFNYTFLFFLRNTFCSAGSMFLKKSSI